MSGRSDILRHLEPVAPPLAAPRVSRSLRRAPTLDHTDFRTLIESASGSVAPTNRPVTLPEGVELTSEQRLRLQRAADEAAAHDGRTSLVLLDGRALLLDVKTRAVTEEVQPGGERDRIITDIDTFIVSSAEETPQGEPTHRLLLARLGRATPRSVADLLAGHGPAPAFTESTQTIKET